MLGVMTWNYSRTFTGPEPLWRDVISKNPNSWMVNTNLGNVLVDNQDYDEAIYNLRYAVQLKDDAQAWANLGVAEFKSGHRADAVTSFQNALRINPNLQQAQVGLNAALGRQR